MYTEINNVVLVMFYICRLNVKVMNSYPTKSLLPSSPLYHNMKTIQRDIFVYLVILSRLTSPSDILVGGKIVVDVQTSKGSCRSQHY